MRRRGSVKIMMGLVLVVVAGSTTCEVDLIVAGGSVGVVLNHFE